MALEGSKEVNDVEEEEKTIAKEETQVMAEEKLEVDLGTDPLKPRPISISLKLLEEEKSDLIQLLKEFKDIFA